MRKQRNMSKMKEQNETPEEEINKIGTSNLLNAEFETLASRMLNDLSWNFNSIKKDTETIKKTPIQK